MSEYTCAGSNININNDPGHSSDVIGLNCTELRTARMWTFESLSLTASHQNKETKCRRTAYDCHFRYWHHPWLSGSQAIYSTNQWVRSISTVHQLLLEQQCITRNVSTERRHVKSPHLHLTFQGHGLIWGLEFNWHFVRIGPFSLAFRSINQIGSSIGMWPISSHMSSFWNVVNSLISNELLE